MSSQSTKAIFKQTVKKFENNLDDSESIEQLELINRRLLATSYSNEEYTEISNNRLRYYTSYYVLAELYNRKRSHDPHNRLSNINKSIEAFNTFIEQLDSIQLETEKAVPFAESNNNTLDPSARRELKIAQYKKEKELETKMLEYKELISDSPEEGVFSTMFNKPSDEEEDEDDDEVVRDYIIRLLIYLASQATKQLQSSQMELELLKNIPTQTSDSDNRSATSSNPTDRTWKLDTPIDKQSLLDKNGKPMRPFTIMPAGSRTTRQQMSEGVFQHSHRLPTMTIDEYLQGEADRGNIIEGGGPASENQPTSKEQLQLDTEYDGTASAEAAQEQQRVDGENWARYTEEVEKGSGNKMSNIG
ncbi:hypothetical protein E3Q15_02388 [Wallemia mellicola]|uniref:TAP42-like protein n=1 Tax=Wallemia mellicola TaxID=1708541 RepID=A0A4T0PJJ2_9BASI|nr:hypothetical protein E3Q14_02505 [Wallemia mellicola]TIC12282.1 hypothetical protein E3Q15_02388 [Wallemia mellicola]TIC56306.1 hypothetical protein E3Q05_01779 [Wallemia mellicola]TIC64868.1 hypothetical protein E3Q01_02494 [Wallemia mellicola]